MILPIPRSGRLTAFTVAVALPLSCVAAALETDNAESWLERMVIASKAINYEGTFVYHAGSDLESMRVVNVVDAQGDQQRLYSLNGDGRQVLRDGDEVTVTMVGSEYFNDASGFYDAPFPLAFSRDFAKLRESYDLRLDRDGRVAGRRTRQIVVEPRDSFRYGYHLWVDEETGLLLRSDLLGTDRRALEQLMFTDISFKPREGCAFGAPQFAVSARARPDNEPTRPDMVDQSRSNWHIVSLPPGFVETSRFKQEPVGDMEGTETALLSDGLATISVYVGRYGQREEVPLGPARVGAVNAFGRILNEYQLLVVGDVPAATVELVANAIRVNQDQGPAPE